MLNPVFSVAHMRNMGEKPSRPGEALTLRLMFRASLFTVPIFYNISHKACLYIVRNILWAKRWLNSCVMQFQRKSLTDLVRYVLCKASMATYSGAHFFRLRWCPGCRAPLLSWLVKLALVSPLTLWQRTRQLILMRKRSEDTCESRHLLILYILTYSASSILVRLFLLCDLSSHLRLLYLSGAVPNSVASL